MPWVRPDRKILPRPSTHNSERSTGFVVVNRKLGRKYDINRVLNPGPITPSARPQLLPLRRLTKPCIEIFNIKSFYNMWNFRKKH